MADPINEAFRPMPAPSAGGSDFAARLAALPPQYQSLLKILASSGVQIQDPTTLSQALQAMRGGENHTMANAAENLSNHLNNGRAIPTSVFDLPTYKQTPGYR